MIPSNPGSKPRIASPSREAGCIFCLHLSADRRTQQLTLVRPDEMGTEPPGRDEWSVECWASESAWAGAVRNAGRLACFWVLLDHPQAARAPRDGDVVPTRTRERHHVAQVLRGYPMRPLLITFAERVDLPPPMADDVQRVILAELAARALAAHPSTQFRCRSGRNLHVLDADAPTTCTT